MNQYVIYLKHKADKEETMIGYTVHTLRQALALVEKEYPDYQVTHYEIYAM